MPDRRPIGVFDSGVGGLTVLRAIHERLPHESTIYVGDLLHFPYGPRAQEEVRAYAFDIIRYLQTREVKLIVIACNTASAAALNQAREVFDVPLVGVISPGAQTAVELTHNGIVGVICTEGTASSQAYVHAIRELDPTVAVHQKPCPELVELVENGKAESDDAEDALRRDLSEIVDAHADVLVLGCTHYPLLTSAIERVYPNSFQIVDSADTTAAKVERILAHSRLEAPAQTAQHELLVTAVPRYFKQVAQVLFGGPVPGVEELPLWEQRRASAS